jgi:hypothetical protein
MAEACHPFGDDGHVKIFPREEIEYGGAFRKTSPSELV